jgi:octaprenyl-diphosphate synthase
MRGPRPGRQEAMQLKDIRALVAADLEAVDDEIRRQLASDVALINQVGDYIVGSGGKRLRPLLVVLAARAAGATNSAHVPAAALIEFIHTATLLHDDVVDDSSRRRGRETANETFGNPASVLVGDFLYSRAFQMMAALDSPALIRVMADATNTIAAGEVMQLMNSGDPETTEIRYMEVIYRKTARLFEAGAQIAAIVAHAPADVEMALGRYGKHLGIAFQLVDDALDYRGDAEELGKNVGDDLAEGKPTLPLIHALRHGGAQAAAMIRSAIEQGGTEEQGPIRAVVESTGGLDYTARLAENEAQRAIDVLGEIPESPFRDALAALARFAVTRKA